MSRDRSNCSVMRVEPSALDEVISVTPAMRPKARSSGVATVAAMVSGLAPGSDACTEIVGKSTCGSGETGSRRKATAPASAIPIVRSVVATGRSMNGFEIFISLSSFTGGVGAALACAPRAAIVDAACQPVKREIDDRRGEERQHLREDQSADHGDSERMAKLG